MAKIKSMRVKLANGNYDTAIPIGANASNIDMANGRDLETTMKDVATQTFVNNAIDTAIGKALEASY